MQKFISTVEANPETLHSEKFDISFNLLRNNTAYVLRNKEIFSLGGFEVVMKRSPYPFFINTYLPSTMLSLTSFIGFLIPVNNEEGRRMALLITVLLTLVTVGGIARNKGPVVSKRSTSFVIQRTFVLCKK